MEPDEYTPDALLDELKARFKLTSDARLAKKLNVSNQIIKSIRRKHSTITGTILIKVQEITNGNMTKIRLTMGDRRRRLRVSGSAVYKR